MVEKLSNPGASWLGMALTALKPSLHKPAGLWVEGEGCVWMVLLWGLRMVLLPAAAEAALFCPPACLPVGSDPKPLVHASPSIPPTHPPSSSTVVPLPGTTTASGPTCRATRWRPEKRRWRPAVAAAVVAQAAGSGGRALPQQGSA